MDDSNDYNETGSIIKPKSKIDQHDHNSCSINDSTATMINLPPIITEIPMFNIRNLQNVKDIKDSIEHPVKEVQTKLTTFTSKSTVEPPTKKRKVVTDSPKQTEDECVLSNRESTTPICSENQSNDPSGSVKCKCVCIGFDGSWHNRIYGRNALNGCATFLDQNAKKIIHFETRTKGYMNYPEAGASGNMEPDMLVHGVAHLQGCTH